MTTQKITLETPLNTQVRFIGSFAIGDDRIYTLKEFVFDDTEGTQVAVIGGGMYDQIAYLEQIEVFNG